MKFPSIFLIFCVCIFSTLAQAQETFEFLVPMSPDAVEGNFQKKYQGVYESLKSNMRYEVTNEDVIIHYTQYESMSKEYMDADLKLYVIDSLLYGMSEKPIPVILDNGRYYFGFIRSISLKESGAVFKRIDEHNYVINIKEGDVFFPRLFTFVGRNLNVADFDYSSDKDLKFLKKINHIQVANEGMTHFQLNPTQRDWERLLKKGFFSTEQMHVKQVGID